MRYEESTTQLPSWRKARFTHLARMNHKTQIEAHQHSEHTEIQSVCFSFFKEVFLTKKSSSKWLDMVINVRRLHKGLDFEITEYIMISQTAHSSCCVANAACGKLVREDSAQWSTKTAQNKWHRRAAAPQPLRPWAGWNFVSLTMSLYGGSLYVTAFISWPGAEIGSREKEKHKGWTIEIRTFAAYIFSCVY